MTPDVADVNTSCVMLQRGDADINSNTVYDYDGMSDVTCLIIMIITATLIITVIIIIIIYL